MDTKNAWIKIIGTNKENFEKSYNFIVKIQDQLDQRVSTLVEETGFVPGPVKEFYRQWMETAKNSREAFRKAADEGYQGIEHYLATTA